MADVQQPLLALIGDILDRSDANTHSLDTAHIYFEPGEDKVLSKQWIDAEHGWKGQNPMEAGSNPEEGSQSQYRSDKKGTQ